MMRRLALLTILMIMTLGMLAQANVLQNPGFEEGDTGQMNYPIPGWFTWEQSGWHHNDAGRVIDTKAVKLWWTDSGYWQDVPVVEGKSYTFSCYMQHHTTDPLSDSKQGIVKAEWRDASDNLLETIYFGTITAADPLNTFILYSADLVAPANAVVGRIVLAMEQPGGGNGSVNYDNASVYQTDLYAQAFYPTPADGASVDLSLDNLFWTNRAAKNPGDTITCDVYFESEGLLPDPNIYDANFVSASPLIASAVTTGTVNLTAAGVTPLVDGYTYTWRVDSTDPNTGGVPVTIPGIVWSFRVSDVPPTVDPDVNDDLNFQYTWVDETDNDGNPQTVSLMLSGSYTDDGKSSIIRAVYEEGAHDKAGGTTVVIGTQIWTPAPDGLSGTVTAPVTITNAVGGQTANGAYRFWLNVEDSAGNSAAEATNIVYLTCIEAATGDPDDPMYQQWIHGDIDGDCDTDLNDFAILAGNWVDCMTPKAGCTP